MALLIWTDVKVLEPIYIGMVTYDMDRRRAFVGSLCDVRLIEVRHRPGTKTFHRRWVINAKVLSNSGFFYTPKDKIDSHPNFQLTREEITHHLYTRLQSSLESYLDNRQKPFEREELKRDFTVLNLPFRLAYRVPILAENEIDGVNGRFD